LRAEAPGFAPTESGPLELEPAVGARGLELVLGPGGSLEGEVLMPPGESPAGVIVGISRGDGFGKTQRTDARGRFHFDRLTAGRWLVEHRSEELSPSLTTSSSGNVDEPQEIPWSCEVWPAATAHFDLDLRGREQTVVEGSLRLDGKPCSGWAVSLLSRGGSGAAAAEDVLDTQGLFRLAVDDAGDYTLQFFGPPDEPPFLFLRQDLELWPGVLPWERDLTVGRIEGRVSPGPNGGDTQLTLRGTGPYGIQVSSGFRPAEDGSFLIAEVPAGEVELSLAVPGAEVQSKSLEVPAGGTVRAVFP